ncbi:YtnP family quorum-quenching lactonase [Cytobacillus sp. IB215665]|uniref:YtnP family quorum-quenching lactonase n=1 Tax=Cytobacillus sp. IB215665 TaxID=3097357 RepID=UPI002A160CE1|nr:MBL fold metallo-hydrolase [Cytobacillus sp. IB215665]MDX8367480.1 MBL fold metallo-hydrolase [Cytobacillus sp. IB215665]
MEQLRLGNFTLTWLNGGVTHLDGGAMFGVVPRPLWSKKYAVNDLNQIELRTDPILIQYEQNNYLIESGIGNNKLTSKQLRNFGVIEESSIDQSLAKLNLSTADIDFVLMTHMHFDHACGLTKWEDDKLMPTFPNAQIITSEVEWHEMKHPNIRSKNTYWENNWVPIETQIRTFTDEIELVKGLKMIHTGGHSDGHSIIVIEEGDEMLLHMADLMPTHAHQNPLWVMAYDDYPMNSIEQKQEWMQFGMKKGAWYSFYHDALYRAIKWDEVGEVISTIKREK